MAHAKRFLFSEEEQLTADFCRVLGHPARYRIVTLLKRHGVLTFCEIAELVPLGNAALQNHFLRLQQVGLIVVGGTRDRTGYKLVQEVYTEMVGVLRGVG